VVVTISGAMRIKKLYPGKKVELLWSNEEKTCLASVGQYGNDKMVLKLLDAGLSFNPGELQDIIVRFTVPDDASYEFTAIVALYHEQSHSLLLENLSSLNRIQQRGSYRLKAARPVFIHLGEGAYGERWLEGVLLDISQTGARLLCSASGKPGDIIKLLVNLDEVEHTLETEAEVIHVTEDEDQVKLGVKFLPLPLFDQGLLLEFIFKLWSENKATKSTL